MASVYPSLELSPPLPPDLRAAFDSAEYLLDTCPYIVELLTCHEDWCETQREAIERAIILASQLSSRIKECESSILAVTDEITEASPAGVKLSSRIDEFPNAHRALLDAGALVCELIWDGAYKERRSLFSAPDTGNRHGWLGYNCGVTPGQLWESGLVEVGRPVA
jgi:hypothetical protein